MIDLHCHFLPGIDDGPESMEEAVRLAVHAVESGISRSVLTPHVHPGRYENHKLSIRTAFESYAEELEKRGIPLRLSFAAEVRVGPEIIPMIENEEIPFLGKLGDHDILLLEFPHGNVPLGSEKLVTWLLSRNIRPLIAHPERNKDILRNFERIIPFVRMGCLLQVTAGSVSGLFGMHARKAAVKLLEKGWVYALASDAHNLEHRPPEMEQGRIEAEKILGSQASRALVRENPATILGLN